MTLANATIAPAGNETIDVVFAVVAVGLVVTWLGVIAVIANWAYGHSGKLGAVAAVGGTHVALAGLCVGFAYAFLDEPKQPTVEAA